MKFFNFHIAPFLKSSLLLSALMSMPLAANTAINESEEFFDELAVRSSSETMRKKKKCKRPCNAQFNNVTACNALVKKNFTVKGTTNLNGQVNNNVGNVYTIYSPTDPNYALSDFPTIQAGIDLVSSGLSPDAAAGSPPSNGGGVTLNIQPGTYVESLFIQATGCGNPINDNEISGGTHDFVGHSLIIRGDTRPIAAMTYMLGGLLEADDLFCSAGAGDEFFPPSPLYNLGTKGSTINNITTTTVPGGPNTLAVVTSATLQPDFGACGIGLGDIIILTDSDGTIYERSVLSALDNTVTYSGDPVVITDLGAALTFCPNVIIQNDDPATICFITGSVLEIVGIWFQANPNVPLDDTGVWVENNSILYCSQLFVDNRFGPEVPALSATNGAQILPVIKERVAGHISILGGLFSLYLASGSRIQYNGTPPYCYIMQTNGFNGVYATLDSSAYFGALQINGALSNGNNALGVQTTQGSLFSVIFNAFNCAYGIYGQEGANIALGASTFLYNCVRGVFLRRGSQMVENGAGLVIDNSSVGVTSFSGSRFICANGVTFANMPVGSQQFTFDTGSSILNGDTDFRTSYPGPYASDADAITAGVQVGGQYVSSYFAATPGAPYVIAQLH